MVLNTNQVHASTTKFEGTVMKVSAPAGAVLVDVLGGKNTTYTVAADGTLDLTLAPVSAAAADPEGRREVAPWSRSPVAV